jgi:purine-binding chemotaxis protein CheW
MQNPTTSKSRPARAQYLSFRIGTDDFAVDILRVQEIRGWENVRALPDSKNYVKGVLDLRGAIVPIIDLRVRFGCTDPEYAPTTVVIVMSIGAPDQPSQLVGAVVDAVSDVLDVDVEELKPAPQIGGTVSRRYLKGMVTLPRGMVILLDLDRMFDRKELDGLYDSAEV